MKVLSVGGGAREHAAVKAFYRAGAEIYAVMKNNNPGIALLSKEVCLCNETDVPKVVGFAEKIGPDMVFIGPEAPLEAGLTDALEEKGISVGAPTKAGAEIETSKEFARNLMKKYGIPGAVDYRVFHGLGGVKEYLMSYGKEYVIKPIGLTGGKGVRVMGDHFTDHDEAMDYIQSVIGSGKSGAGVVIEEKLVGEEFTVQAFTDGTRILPTPAVQDNKRAYEGDRGPNTGGMGSYSRADGLLPFLSQEDYDSAVEIIKKTVEAMNMEGRPYRGVIYGQFILTADGVKVIEFNARFGDPEAMNVLSTLKTSMVDIYRGIIEKNLMDRAEFEPVATVCKYIVPEGYGTRPLADQGLTIDENGIAGEGAELFYASVDERINEQTGEKELYTTTSRSIGVLGKSRKEGNEGIFEAEEVAERALKFIEGKIFLRHDIGKKDYIERKIERMKSLRGVF